jgi:hypothetical protein
MPAFRRISSSRAPSSPRTTDVMIGVEPPASEEVAPTFAKGVQIDGSLGRQLLLALEHGPGPSLCQFAGAHESCASTRLLHTIIVM